MGTKRSHPTSTSTSRPSNTTTNSHKRRRVSPPDDDTPSANNRGPRSHQPNHKAQPKKNPINPLKSRIRSITRLLEHSANNDDDKTPAGVRVARERELASLRTELEDAEQDARRKKMIGKWHMVRFFERRRAERRLGRVKKEAKAKDDAARGEVHDAEVDLMYTLYFPLDLPYVLSLIHI